MWKPFESPLIVLGRLRNCGQGNLLLVPAKFKPLLVRKDRVKSVHKTLFFPQRNMVVGPQGDKHPLNFAGTCKELEGRKS